MRDVALAGASATIASDALMNPFDGEYSLSSYCHRELFDRTLWV